jgi:hypothetical protein
MRDIVGGEAPLWAADFMSGDSMRRVNLEVSEL